MSGVAGRLHAVDNGAGSWTVEGDIGGGGVANFSFAVVSKVPLDATAFCCDCASLADRPSRRSNPAAR